MLAIIKDRFKDGIFILDEPGNSIIFDQAIRITKYFDRKAKRTKGSIHLATHSPILMALPNADFYYLFRQLKE